MSKKLAREVSAHSARIAGVVSCVPSRVIANDYFLQKFGEGGVSDVVKMIGVETRRWVSKSQTTVDLCCAAGKRLMERLEWSPETVDAVIFVSQTPDYRLPASACVLQNLLDIPPGIIAFDVNLGCSGYPYALWLAMTMVQTNAADRVLIAVGDTISKIVDPSDRATALLFGDAGTVTAIDRSSHDCSARFILGTDGRGASNLFVPQGAYRLYNIDEDSRLNSKDPSCLFMDGGEIFTFTLRAVPELVSRTSQIALASGVEHDYYLFHQANLFMIKHLVKKCQLPAASVPLNIQEYGNTSSASIPLLLTSRLSGALREKSLKLALFGFGVGYSWASASLEVDTLAEMETIEI